MKDTELVAALRQLKVNTKSLACLGCGYENNCSIHGCHLIGMAADRLSMVDSALFAIRFVCETSRGALKSTLGTVLSLFEAEDIPPWMIPKTIVPEPGKNARRYASDEWSNVRGKFLRPALVHDFELCADTKELAQTLQFIDKHGYTMVSATQDTSGAYTVFFRRPARE